jgi:hypothetical protein
VGRLGLEAATLSLYPGWLHLDAVLMEFTTMSFVGHLFYRGVLGLISAVSSDAMGTLIVLWWGRLKPLCAGVSSKHVVYPRDG